MTNAQREVLLSPATADGVDITCANSTSFNLDVNVIITKRLWLELVLMEFSPCLRPVDLEACECIWINHYETMKKMKYRNREVAMRCRKRARREMRNL
jgi:hypothetical protein